MVRLVHSHGTYVWVPHDDGDATRDGVEGQSQVSSSHVVRGRAEGVAKVAEGKHFREADGSRVRF